MSEIKRVFGFIGFMLVYALLFAIAALGCIRIADTFLTGYEESRPEHFMEAYAAALAAGELEDAADHVEYSYDPKLMTENELRELFISSFGSDISYKADPLADTQTGLGYRILSGGRHVGTVVIRQAPEPAAGGSWMSRPVEKLKSLLDCSFGQWEPESQEFYFQTPQAQTMSVTVPEDWSVMCGDYTLDGEYITGESKIESIAGYYGVYELPMLKTYTVSAYTGGRGLRVFDPSGKEVQLRDKTADNENIFVNRLFAEDSDSVRSAVSDFLILYIAYCSGAVGDRHDNLAALREVLLPGSDLDSRMQQALEGQYYTHSQGDVIKSIRYNLIIADGDSRLADISYVLQTTGYNGTVTTENNAGIYFTVKDGVYLADRYISY